MNKYFGAVFFVDILGVGALTRGKVPLQDSDFLSHKFRMEEDLSEHIFCAKLLTKFRRILVKVQNNNDVQVAQLSDCAFIWSNDTSKVLDAAREIMWASLMNGILCRGGISYGEIVEPNKTKISLGRFICGKAVTEAVKLEGIGKGARVFIDDTVPSEVPHILQTDAFRQNINPLDYSYVDEFLWGLYPEKLSPTLGLNSSDSKRRLGFIIDLIAKLRFDPIYRWNASTQEGHLQIASTIDAISSVTKKLQNKLDYHSSCGSIQMAPDSRSK